MARYPEVTYETDPMLRRPRSRRRTLHLIVIDWFPVVATLLLLIALLTMAIDLVV